MKKRLAFLALLFLCKGLFPQSEYATIKGSVYRVSQNEQDTLPVENAEIVLSVSETIKLMVLSNAKGEYRFNIKKFTGTVNLACVITKNARIPGKRNPCILSNNDVRFVNLDPAKNVEFVADFYHREGCCYQRYPELFFKANSLNFETDSVITIGDNPEEFINAVSTILTENPNIVIAVDAHCDKREKNKKELAVKRAEFIQDQLFTKGIPRERVVLKAYMDLQPVISEKEINAAKSLTEKCILMAKNRCVKIKVISFDYGAKDKPSQTKPNTDDGED